MQRRFSALKAPRRRRLVRWAAAACCAIIVLAVVGVGDGSVHLGAVAASSSAPCPQGESQCVTLTPPSCTGTCLTVTAGPTLDVGNGQAVYFTLSNATANGTVRVAYCPVSSTGAIISSPTTPGDAYCANEPYNGIQLSPSIIPVTGANTLSSFVVAPDAGGEGNAPITSQVLIYDGSSPSSFFCDNGPDYCALVFTDDGPGVGNSAGNPPVSASNSVVVPLNFFGGINGCPTSDAQVFTDSAFSIEHLIPAAIDSTCTTSTGVVAVNTATNTQQVIDDFAAGGTEIAFTDDPEDPTQVAALANVPHAFIPISLSATVVAFLAGDAQQSQRVGYPATTFNLTPNMVAGLLTSNYTESYGSDGMIPPLKCSQIKGCSDTNQNNNTDAYDAFDYLSPAPPGLVGPGEFGLFFSSVASGASYQVTDWFCSAPNVAYTVDVPLKSKGGKESPVSVADTHDAKTTTTTPPQAGVAWPPAGDPSAKWPYQTCNAYPVLPVLSASNAQYSFRETPTLQAAAIRGYAYGGGGSPTLNGPTALGGFGAMDWSEAAYNGLFSANLQNAAGKLVGPSQASLDAALADATTGSDGVLLPNYNNTSDAAAYPMPLVTYAVVSTAPQPAASVTAEKNLLSDLLSYSRNGGSVPMPAGYVPLPDNIYNAAQTDMNTDLVAQADTTSTTTSSTTPPPPSATSSSNGSSNDNSTPSSGISSSSYGGTLFVPRASGTVSQIPSVLAAPAKIVAQAVAKTGAAVLGLITGKQGWLLGGIMIGALALLFSGGVIVLAVRLWTRRWPTLPWFNQASAGPAAPGLAVGFWPVPGKATTTGMWFR